MDRGFAFCRNAQCDEAAKAKVAPGWTVKEKWAGRNIKVN